MLTVWQQHTRPARLHQDGWYSSPTPCCGREVDISLTRLRHGHSAVRRCADCQRLWHVRFATDDVGEHFAYWRRQDRPRA